MRLYEKSEIFKIEEMFGIRATKSLGQNFLIDKGIIDSIVEGTLSDEETLAVEIGPGLGVLTRELAEKAKKVVAVEIDKNLIPVLNYTLGEFDNVEIINDDILKVNIGEIVKKSGCTKATIVGNLPYYITTPIIMGILESGTPADRLVFMMQKEVADRIMAKPSTKDYGALSVAVQYYCEIEKIVSAPRSAFSPVPGVDSIVLGFTLRKEPPVKLLNEKMFFDTVKAGFGMRRKTLSNALSTLKGKTKEQILSALENCGIDPMRRAETLSLDEFAELSNEFFKQA